MSTMNQLELNLFYGGSLIIDMGNHLNRSLWFFDEAPLSCTRSFTLMEFNFYCCIFLKTFWCQIMPEMRKKYTVITAVFVFLFELLSAITSPDHDFFLRQWRLLLYRISWSDSVFGKRVLAYLKKFKTLITATWTAS